MPVDPSIPLAAGNFQAPSAQTMMSMAAMAQQYRAAMQAQNAQNRLRELYSDDSNLDDQGNLNNNALKQVMQVDPNVGLQIQQNQLRNQQARLQMQMLSSDTFAKQMDMGRRVQADARAAYEDVLKSGGQEQQAIEAGQRMLDEGVGQMRASGAVPEQMMKQFRTQFDPQDYSRFEAGYLKYQDLKNRIEQNRTKNKQWGAEYDLNVRKVENSEANTTLRGAELHKPDWDVVTDPGNHGLPYRLDKNSGTTVTLSGQPYTPVSAARLSSGAGGAARNPTQAATAQFAAEHPDATSDDWAKFNQNLKSGGQMGGRESVMLGRVMTAAQDTMKDLGNIMELPVTSTTGWFGGRKQGPGLFDAAKESLTNAVTSQEVQDFNVHTVGLGRAMASIESMGLAPNQHFQDQFDRLMLKEGDSQLTKMRKLASIRQQVESGIDTSLASPRISDAQKKLLEDAKANIEKSVPFTPHDVTELEKAKDPKTTLRQFAAKQGLGGEEQKSAAPKTEGGVTSPTTQDEYDALPKGALYKRPDGKVYRKG